MTDQTAAGGFISEITFKNRESITLQQNDIVLIVGPNNSGKSQFLSEIHSLSRSNPETLIIQNLNIEKSQIPIKNILEEISVKERDADGYFYNGLDFRVFINESTEREFYNNDKFGDFTDIFICKLNTSSRLSICDPAPLINEDVPKSHPIHYAANSKFYRDWLSGNFKKAFGQNLIPHTFYGSSIPLCIGTPPKTSGGDQYLLDNIDKFKEILKNYPKVHLQGDGIKSFTGILLHLMLDYRRIFLIDEPEAFLHPPQAKILGKIMGESFNNSQQAFISTHSEAVIQGLLESCSNRIKIIRITREGNINHFSILNHNHLEKLWSDPLLKYSNIMSSLFHKEVVLCESDSDCKMYSLIENQIKQTKGVYSETLFIHCGGKHRIGKIANALLSLDINVKTIVDIDVLDDQNILKSITEPFDIQWDTIQKHYKNIYSAIHTQKEKIKRNTAKNHINRILESTDTPYLTATDIREISNELKTESKWSSLKKSGIYAMPAGQASKSFEQMKEILNNKGIFIVPVGELENFVKNVGGHGPEWVNRVLDTYPNLDDSVYDNIKKFISDMNL